MPRIMFDNFEEAKGWIKTFMDEKNYVGYFTEKDELIFVPIKSTRPTTYCYIKDAKLTEVSNFFKDRLMIFRVKNFDWNAESAISRKE